MPDVVAAARRCPRPLRTMAVRSLDRGRRIVLDELEQLGVLVGAGEDDDHRSGAAAVPARPGHMSRSTGAGCAVRAR